MYTIAIKPSLEKELMKLSKKNKKQVEIIFQKIAEVAKHPLRYKNLRAPLQEFKRVHIDSHFVLLFSVDIKNSLVTLERYAHHDKIYS